MGDENTPFSCRNVLIQSSIVYHEGNFVPKTFDHLFPIIHSTTSIVLPRTFLSLVVNGLVTGFMVNFIFGSIQAVKEDKTRY